MPMKFPLMRNNILREDLDAVIEHLKQDDPILTHGAQRARLRGRVVRMAGREAQRVRQLGRVGQSADDGDAEDAPSGGRRGHRAAADLGLRHRVGAAERASRRCSPTSIRARWRWIPTQVLAKITARTRAVFLTHVQGFDGLTDELLAELDAKRNIPLIEDVCESHGATHGGRKLGSFGWMSNFSFYYAHHMSTIEGGMVCTDDAEVYQQVRMLRSHGMVREASDAAVREAYQSRKPGSEPGLHLRLSRPTTCATPRSAASSGAASSSGSTPTCAAAPTNLHALPEADRPRQVPHRLQARRLAATTPST